MVVEKILQQATKIGEDGSPEYSFTTPKKCTKMDKPPTDIYNSDKPIVDRNLHNSA